MKRRKGRGAEWKSRRQFREMEYRGLTYFEFTFSRKYRCIIVGRKRRDVFEIRKSDVRCSGTRQFNLADSRVVDTHTRLCQTWTGKSQFSRPAKVKPAKNETVRRDFTFGFPSSLLCLFLRVRLPGNCTGGRRRRRRRSAKVCLGADVWRLRSLLALAAVAGGSERLAW